MSLPSTPFRLAVFALLVGAAYPSDNGMAPRPWPLCDQAVLTTLASREDVPGIPLFEPNAEVTLLLARATRDTVLAGPGRVFEQANTFLQADRRPVYGQLVDVDRVAGAAAGRLRPLLRESNRPLQVVVVPWGMDLACHPYFWHGTAQWTAPDSLAVFAARLRPDDSWVNGRATFDVLKAEVHTYAYGPNLWFRATASPTAIQVFDRNARTR